MALLDDYMLALVSAFVLVVLAFCLALARHRRYDIIDVFWGLLFIGIVWVVVAVHQKPEGVLVAAMVTIWGARLSTHIFSRWRRSPEDKRYIALRNSWPKRYRTLQMFVRVYVVQALLASIVALPAIVFIGGEARIGSAAMVGFAIWLIGFLTEMTADRQLRQFLRQPTSKGKLMDQGIWHYSRHPNYFGEIVMWWGIAIMCIGLSGLWLAVIGALTITTLILFVSGVPLAEKSMQTKPGWDEYVQRTSVLVPLPNRKR